MKSYENQETLIIFLFLQKCDPKPDQMRMEPTTLPKMVKYQCYFPPYTPQKGIGRTMEAIKTFGLLRN